MNTTERITSAEQYVGNKRFLCPACGKSACVSIRIGPLDYHCPTNKERVTAQQVALAPVYTGPGIQ